MKRKDKNVSRINYLLKKFKLISGFIVISIVFSSCTSAAIANKDKEPKLEIPSKSEFNTVKVVRGSLSNVCNGGGRMVSAVQQNFSFKVGDGYLKSLNFQQGDKIKKGDVLAELDCTDLENQLKEQEIKLKIAELNYNNLKSKGADSGEINTASLNVEIQKVEIKKLKDKLSRKNLISNMNGIITYVNNLRIGDPVTPYTTMFTISDTEHLLIEYTGQYVNELKMGMKAQIEYNGKQYKGKVVAAPIVKDDNSSMNTPNSSIFIAIDNFSNKVAEIGDNVKLYIEIMKKDNVLKIPFKALHSFNESMYVYVLENGEKVERSVKVGLINYSEVEITSGLKEGEEVIID